MSEFSESYHLRSNRAEDACDLLRRVGVAGYVYPAASGWVTFLAEGGSFEPDQRIVAAARQPLLHYVSAEDHGWSFALFDGGNVACDYRCDWNDDLTFDDSRYSRAALQRLVPSMHSEALAEFEQCLRPTDLDELFESEPSKLFAQAVGLEHYDWLAYDYVDSDIEDSPDEFSHVTKVP